MFSCPLRRWCAPVVVWFFCLATLFVSRVALAGQPYPSVVSRSEREEQIVAELKNDVEGFDFVETELELFVQAIGDIHKIQIVLDRPALRASGLDPTIPVTSVLSRISLRSALRQTLAPLGLTYTVRDEVLLITTPDSPNAFEVRCYNVRQLLGDNRSTDELTFSLSRILNTPTVASVGGFGGPEEGFGGGRGPGPGEVAGRCIATFGNVIIVRDTADGHEQIGKVLATLRDVLREDNNVSPATTHFDRSVPRATIRREAPEAGRSRRRGDTVNENRVDDPFASPMDGEPSTDPFGDLDASGRSADNPFGDFNESNGPETDNPFGE